jgi:hypothetical protein
LYNNLKLDVKAGISVGSTGGGVKTTSEGVLRKLVPFSKIPGVKIS